ncbi:MAG: hypothetical protein EOQ86_02370 [Mesorhizobium sp.]|uniref:hypothetical protein n=1 Tax=Mesorhizobium sp. TaxID=1871066 RepID=UPI000FE9E86D|nr:hypothetical protein [Mesorhizobium sp.]RWH84593.1 MAG: hypothetical protein EOQ85_03360 [Mesorhizobium sp.]RWH86982.1 MAG: hypothetical protein EOQ86_02370 [Mesorhizobium sp.]RWH93481.1 MAG: hypothetical protein EOQ87_02760 [Mesorhizobium sp.]RWI03063.1 MAG: hypothetical protein EOQ88_02370 [Mesorhizobium sp.]RWI05571.1 MAG: hypothetical protein EOQ89_06405 [Mesorhizobium sp.]
MVLDIRAKQVADEHHAIVVIGAGFDSAFFLHQFVRRRKARVPVLEWGRHNTDDRQLERGPNSNIQDEDTYSGRPWIYTIGLKGGTNCGFGQMPPFHIHDFRLKGLCGIGLDWPISCDDLEPFCCAA